MNLFETLNRPLIQTSYQFPLLRRCWNSIVSIENPISELLHKFIPPNFDRKVRIIFLKLKLLHLYTQLTKNQSLFEIKQRPFPLFGSSSTSIVIPSGQTFLPAFTIFFLVFFRENGFAYGLTGNTFYIFVYLRRILYSTFFSKHTANHMQPKGSHRLTVIWSNADKLYCNTYNRLSELFRAGILVLTYM